MEKIKCKHCPYYSGIQCEGHGEYHGHCNLITSLKKTIASINQISYYDLKVKNSGAWDNFLNDESNCLILEMDKK